MTISALAWVPKGAAAEEPLQSNMTDAEYERISGQMKSMLLESKQDLANAQPGNSTEIEDIYDMEHYDDESDDSEAEVDPLKSTLPPIFSNDQQLAFHPSNQEDPYIELDDAIDNEQELDELKIAPTDNLIITAKTEDDVSHLEIYVYEDDEHLYVHHDILLPSFPLALEWLDYPIDSSRKGNYVAVGTFDPHVEIWDLDTVDSVFPALILGAAPPIKEATGKKKKRLAHAPNAERHVDAVLSISWNKTHKNLIATGSADTTIKLWDLQKPEVAAYSYTNHSDKVSCVAWNPLETTVLLSGGYDKQACVFDSRAPTSVARFSLSSDVECMAWDPFVKELFYVSTEDGLVQCFDVRHAFDKKVKPVWTIHAHDDAVSALAIHPTIPGCLLTGSADKTVKLWSVKSNKASCVVSRDLDLGRVFSASFSPDSNGSIAIAGSKGKMMVWNVSGIKGVSTAFPTLSSSAKPEITQLANDDEVSDQEDNNKEEIMEE